MPRERSEHRPRKEDTLYLSYPCISLPVRFSSVSHTPQGSPTHQTVSHDSSKSSKVWISLHTVLYSNGNPNFLHMWFQSVAALKSYVERDRGVNTSLEGIPGTAWAVPKTPGTDLPAFPVASGCHSPKLFQKPQLCRAWESIWCYACSTLQCRHVPRFRFSRGSCPRNKIWHKMRRLECPHCRQG